MTDLNNSNAGDERPNPTPNDGDDLDAAWESFARGHADELRDVERSRSAKRFERHAQRKEKEMLVSIEQLDEGVFTDDRISMGARARGPRDTTNSSWLDADDVMDRYGSDFTPPNPSIGPVKTSKLVFWILLVAGIAGIIASVFVPTLAALLGSVFGLCALIGAAGLIIQHKGHTQTRDGWTDDGARV
ncbi:hypothetical protein [Bifidobacterium samirii]|uniref:Membrane associated protein n=1 Tax=Bifidobacterium samirii TaxID=2306974 RepID=A0A430FF21_9BIFI|nr:hypothetical protein [Bifidobacterium samirii]RSX51342.1 membrane associated protein [Bifidobacterium samirii]